MFQSCQNNLYENDKMKHFCNSFFHVPDIKLVFHGIIATYIICHIGSYITVKIELFFYSELRIVTLGVVRHYLGQFDSEAKKKFFDLLGSFGVIF